ncbi:hypothetical protein CHS0354_008720 [Potamilus streckersoni]|uniref:Uncharacterized protein n=1 Tax=Potamilus streckersoni TaxID=2493646 RepID=A0AAE0SBR0_9BIVA|nr:hypothetical protein CHS0354_008720 [Potamilus streckersoni]
MKETGTIEITKCKNGRKSRHWNGLYSNTLLNLYRSKDRLSERGANKDGRKKTFRNSPAPFATRTEINNVTSKYLESKTSIPPFNNENMCANRKMEFIKYKLEKSREKLQEKKRMQEELDLKCGPRFPGTNLTSYFNRSVSDLGSLRRRGENDGFPYVYFVVADEKISASDSFRQEQFLSTSDKRRRQSIAQANKRRKAREKDNAKIKSLSQELGLNSHPQKADTKSNSENCSQTPDAVGKNTEGQRKVSRIVFPLDIISKPRNPTTTLATIGSSLEQEDKPDAHSSEVDEMRGESYKSKVGYIEGRPKNFSYTMKTFESPFISSHQKGETKRTNKLKKSDQQESSNKVTFAKPIPVIRGNTFVVQETGTGNLKTLGLGSRSKTMSDIDIDAEKSSCQKIQNEPSFLLQNLRRTCLPLNLPKIDIVSKVSVDMVMNMIKGYLHDPKTTSRQSQLASQLLAHLQAQELEKKKKIIKRKEEYDDAVTSASSLSQGTIKPASREEHMSSQSDSILASRSENELEKHISAVKIKFNSKEADATTQERSFSSHTGVSKVENRHAKDTNFVPVAPTCFKMAPPGLSRENTKLVI